MRKVLIIIAAVFAVATASLIKILPAEACTFFPDLDPICFPDQMYNMVKDCDEDDIAESTPQAIEVFGDGLFYWEDLLGLHATVHWMDENGAWWIRASNARHDGSGSLIIESGSCSL